MVNNIYPQRSVAVIDALANKLLTNYLSHYQMALTLPIPVEDIAEQFLGYDIDFSETGIFSNPEILGGIDFERNKIYVNTSVANHDGRYSFTVAHELGHHILHREYYLQYKDIEDSNMLCRMKGRKPQIEIEADRFAAALLIPYDNVFDAVAQQVQRVVTIGQAKALSRNLIENRGFSNVSNSAMINRLKDLNILPPSIPYQAANNKKNYAPPSTSKFLLKLFLKYQNIILGK